jgi:hypothetical protein
VSRLYGGAALIVALAVLLAVMGWLLGWSTIAYCPR